MTRQQFHRIVEIDRIEKCLLYLLKKPSREGLSALWTAEVMQDARGLGYRLETPARPGSNCRPDIDRGITYGGDMEDVF